MDWPAVLSPDARLDFWTMLVAGATSVSCAVVGCYLVLRRMSLLGDAISHAALAGIALAYLLTGTRDILPLLAGAFVVGLLTVFLTQSLHVVGRVPEDSSIGIVFTSLFAFGAIVISQVRIDLDAQCVLFGDLDFVVFDQAILFGLPVPRVLLTLVPVLIATVAFVAIFWKELKIATFDPLLATAMGLSAVLIHGLLMTTVALVTVASLEAVGAILVVALLIVPAATAQLLTDRLWTMLLCAVGVGLASAILGRFGARWLDVRGAGMMAVVQGGLFALALLFAPRQGLLAKAGNQWRLRRAIAAQQMLVMLARYERGAELGHSVSANREACLVAAGGGFPARLALRKLERRGHIRLEDANTVALTDAGRQAVPPAVLSSGGVAGIE